MGIRHKYSKEPADDKGNFKIRDETLDKWVTDGNGRQYRTNEKDTDNIISELEERTEGS